MEQGQPRADTQATVPISAREATTSARSRISLASSRTGSRRAGATEARKDLVKRSSRGLREKMARILFEAEVSAEEIRTEAQQEEPRHRRSRAGAGRRHEAVGRRVRGAHAQDADQYGEKTPGGGLRTQELILGDSGGARQDDRRRAVEGAPDRRGGAQRRGDIEVGISDLVRAAETRFWPAPTSSAGELEATVSRHTPRPGSDEFATPAELDPAVRKGGQQPAAEHGQRSESASRPPGEGRPRAPEGRRQAGSRPDGRFTRASGLAGALDAALGQAQRLHHGRSPSRGKLPVRERVERLVDPESFAEEALLANWDQEGLGADGS